jgi:hypothetical protein
MKKIVRCFLFCSLILLVSQYSLQHVKATPPSKPAQLLFASKESVSSEKAAISLLTRYKESIINALASYQPSFSINLPYKPKDWRESYIEINQLDFLYEKASIEKRKPPFFDKVYLPVKGQIFKVVVPIVLKGSSYRKESGKIIIRVDKNTKEHFIAKDSKGGMISEQQIIEDIPVFATTTTFLVDKEGNVYY